ncbi:hypothetical protein H5410_008779 [Solanum commersonii]|uniref:Uncharacterized protein n=1 Tax=Solanum commersonii TaxID=4109 RepID=A0A9J6AGL2_SOLCO|nr:hypothetical protein H5410_008779 [Solanum commersonii]
MPASTEESAVAIEVPETLAIVESKRNHPLYLHSSDTPGSILTTVQLTGAENYSLEAKSKLGFVLGTCKRNDYTLELAEQWEKCNAFVLAWIMNTVSKELLSGIVYASDAAMKLLHYMQEEEIILETHDMMVERKNCFKLIGYLEDWKFKKKVSEQGGEQSYTNPVRGMNSSKGKNVANNVQLEKVDEDLGSDAFGAVNAGQTYAQGSSHDFNSIHANLQAFAARSDYTPSQHQKIMKLLNEDEKPREIANMAVSRDVVFKENVFPFNKMQQDEHIPIVSGHELFVDDTVLNDTHIHGHADHAVENTTQQAESAHDFMMTAPVPLVEPAPLVDHEVDAMDVLVRDQDEQGVQHVVPHRTSTRVSYPPLWMKYYAATVTDSIPHSLANYMTYMKLSPTYQAYLSAISTSRFSGRTEPVDPNLQIRRVAFGKF